MDVQAKINNIYEKEYSKLANFYNYPKLKNQFVNFYYGRSAWFRLHNIALMRYNLMIKKIGYSMAMCRLSSGDSTTAYALIYKDLENRKTRSYIAVGPSFNSSDGEYRPYFLQLDVFLAYYDQYIEVFSHIESYLIKKIKDKQINLDIEIFYGNNSSGWENELNESRISIKLYCLAWLLTYWQIYNNIMPNHTFKNYNKLMFSDGSKVLYESLKSYLGDAELLKIILDSNKFYENYNIKNIKQKRNSSLQLGHKLIPLTKADILNFKNPKYRPWRELYVDRLVGKLVINLITPGVSVLGDYFFIQNTDHGMFDNDAMHTKIDHSQIGEDIIFSLEETRKKTQHIDDDDENYLNMRFKALSDQIESSIEFTEAEVVMSGITMCKVVENIGFTIRDIITIGGKDPYNMIGPLLMDHNVFAKYMFELIYTLLCLNTKLGVIQGDLHLNNAVINPFAQVDYPKNKTVVVYDLDNKLYTFPHYGSFAGIIDFSRAIISKERIKSDFNGVFSDEFVIKQKVSIIASYKMFFPEFYKKNSYELNELLNHNYELVFKLASAFDSYRLIGDMIILMNASKVRINAKNIKMLEMIKSISLNYLTYHMQKAINGDRSFNFPHADIIDQCFSDFIRNPTEEERICDLYQYNNELKYDTNDEKDFPPIIQKEFDIKIREKFKLEPLSRNIEYSDYRKTVPQDFTDMVKRLKINPPRVDEKTKSQKSKK